VNTDPELMELDHVSITVIHVEVLGVSSLI
jgi:hypothetical protein